MIIAGWYGVGKTFCADNFPRVMDFDHLRLSSNQGLFVNTLETIEKIGYDVLVDIRHIKTLKDHNANFIVVIPNINLKDEYVKRYEAENLPKEEIGRRLNVWDESLTLLNMSDDYTVVTLGSGEYLSNTFLKWSSGFQTNYGLSLVNRNELRDKLRQLDTVEWEYNNPRDKVFSIIDSLHEYNISRKDIV